MPVDKSIDPTADQVRALRDDGPEGPIVMVNLLKFRAQADYGDRDAAPCSGEEAYNRYQRAFSRDLQRVSGLEIVFSGPVQQVFIGQADAPAADWDRVLIVRYPSRQHFLSMMAHPDYRLALEHRYAGLERTVLLQCA
jgi:uncharacterized protein (DUF1330 family)